MKIHTKKKSYQRDMKKAALDGLINDQDGKMVRRLDRNGADTNMHNYFAGHRVSKRRG